MSNREKSPASESSSSATPPPIGGTASPDTTSPGGTVNASGSGPTVPPSAPPGAFVMPPGMAMPPGMQFLPYFPQPAAGGSSGGGDSNDPNAPAQPQQMMIHPAFIPQMYSYPYPGMMPAGMKLKRRQVKNACTNCQKACKKCDDERPCPRCVKYGIADECQDSVRKERRKGIKRGSYKKKGESEDGDATQQPAFMPYPAQLYSQWAAAAMSAAGAAGGKPGETPNYYPYFIAPVPQPGASGSGEAGTSGEGQTATANAIAANPYFSQMYYGGYPPGYPVPPGYGPESSAAAGSSKSGASNTVKSEEESEDELEEEEEEEPEESPKRKSSKKKRRSD